VPVHAAEDHHVAAYVRAVELYDRAADGRRVALYAPLDYHVAAEGYDAVSHVAAHANRAAESEHVAGVVALDDKNLARLLGLRRALRARGRRQ
jgi:hypothetical protein